MVSKREVALAVIFRDDRVLVALRAKGPLAGCWEFPGGGIEVGETVEDAAIRECVEELGIRVRPLESIGRLEHADEDLSLTLHVVLCDLEGGAEPRPLAAKRLAWVTLAELAALRIPEPNFQIIEILKEKRGTR